MWALLLFNLFMKFIKDVYRRLIYMHFVTSIQQELIKDGIAM